MATSDDLETLDFIDRKRKPVKTKRRTKRFYCVLALGILGAVVLFFLGFIIGYFAMKGSSESTPTDSSGNDESKAKNGEYNYKKYHEQLVDSLQAESVEEFAR